jgi:hypothetical protein
VARDGVLFDIGFSAVQAGGGDTPARRPEARGRYAIG